jgi:hypothetical protein
MNEIKEKSYGFEAVMLGATKDKNGFVLKLAIHPNDVPVDLVADPVGSRYMIGMAKLNDQKRGLRKGCVSIWVYQVGQN